MHTLQITLKICLYHYKFISIEQVSIDRLEQKKMLEYVVDLLDYL